MGSRIDEKHQLTVLVTGFGPFRDGHPINPSWEIASRLPEYLPRPQADEQAAARIPEVRIVTHPTPVRVQYRAVRELVPLLWDGNSGARVDFAIHIGMASSQPTYRIERRGHRSGYKSPDVDGEMLTDEDPANRGPGWIWHGLPDELETELDMPDVLARWQKYSPDQSDLGISNDAGHYLCDFIYYSSLAHLYKQRRPRKVVFLHVPSSAADKFVTQGRELVLGLVRAIAESETRDGFRPEQRTGMGD